MCWRVRLPGCFTGPCLNVEWGQENIETDGFITPHPHPLPPPSTLEHLPCPPCPLLPFCCPAVRASNGWQNAEPVPDLAQCMLMLDKLQHWVRANLFKCACDTVTVTLYSEEPAHQAHDLCRHPASRKGRWINVTCLYREILCTGCDRISDKPMFLFLNFTE